MLPPLYKSFVDPGLKLGLLDRSRIMLIASTNQDESARDLVVLEPSHSLDKVADTLIPQHTSRKHDDGTFGRGRPYVKGFRIHTGAGNNSSLLECHDVFFNEQITIISVLEDDDRLIQPQQYSINVLKADPEHSAPTLLISKDVAQACKSIYDDRDITTPGSERSIQNGLQRNMMHDRWAFTAIQAHQFDN